MLKLPKFSPKKKFTEMLNLTEVEKPVIVILSLIVFVVFNILIGFIPYRFDLSQNKAYTLSPATSKIIKKLDDVVNIKVFISSDLPLRLLPLKTDVIDLIREYEKQGRNKIRVAILDPKKNPKIAKEAQEFGIPPLQFSEIQKDKYNVTSSYFGIAILFGDKKEIIPQAVNISSLEFDITSAIYKLSRKESLSVALVDFPASPDIRQDPFTTFKRTIQRQYDLNSLEVSSQSGEFSFAPEVKASLFYVDGQKKYTPENTKTINKYLKSGGAAIFMVDGVFVKKGLTTDSVKHNLFDFFKDYGMVLNRDLILSENAEVASFTTQFGAFFTRYPFWLKTTNFNRQRQEFSNVQNLVLPWASSIDILDKGSKIKVLVRSDRNSWVQMDSFTLIPDAIEQPQKADFKQYNLIVESVMRGGGRLMVIPSSRFIQENYIAKGGGNLEFLLNTISNYASQGALSGIRARDVQIVPLIPTSEKQKDIIKYVNIILLPGLFLIFGGARIVRRRKNIV